MRIRILLTGICAAALISGGHAQAQTTDERAPDTLEDIVVTAQKRSENIQDVPIAITALTSATLRDKGVSNVQDLTGIAPGLQIRNADSSANAKIFIRGVGSSDFNPTSPGAVGIYVDGVYIGSPLAQMGSFFDLERIEVLRGPQGTLYGRNTTGGAINVITKQPSSTFKGDASIEYGNYNSVTLNAGVGGPIIQDKLAFRIAGQYIRDDGATFNRFTGDHVNNANRWAGRFSLLYTPTSDLEILAQVHGGKNNGGARQGQVRGLFPNTPGATGPDGLCLPAFYNTPQCTDILGYVDTDNNPYAGSYNLQGKSELRLFGASVRATWDIGSVSLVSISAYDSLHHNLHEDTDGSPNQGLEINYRADQNQFTQELRLQSNGDGPLKWVAGLYYLHENLKPSSELDILRMLRPLFITPDNPTGVSIPNTVFLAGFPYTQKTNGYAAFGQVDYKITDRLTGTIGLRWSRDSKDFDYTSVIERSIILFRYQDSKNFSSLSGRLGLQYALSDDARIYASYNRGYKSGGFFGGYTTDPANLAPYADEKVNAYEIGLKTELFDHHVRFNVAAFLYDYKNLQVYSIVDRGGVSAQTLDNASNAKMYGGEAEIVASPLHGLDISLGASVLKANYKNYQSFGEDLSGNRLPASPKFTFNGTVHYETDLPFGGGLETTLDATYRTSVYFEPHNLDRLKGDALWLVNGRIGWKNKSGQLGVGLWVRNLFDKTYVLDAGSVETYGSDGISIGTPRTFGVYVRHSF
jgi:iron complex outermembrane receptor protein